MEERIYFDDVDRYGPQTLKLELTMPTEEVDRDEMAQIEWTLSVDDIIPL